MSKHLQFIKIILAKSKVRFFVIKEVLNFTVNIMIIEMLTLGWHPISLDQQFNQLGISMNKSSTIQKIVYVNIVKES